MKKECRVERQVVATTDGMCPLCMKKKIEELEAKLALCDRTQYTMVHNKWLSMMQEKMNAMDMKINEMAEEKTHVSNLSFHWY